MRVAITTAFSCLNPVQPLLTLTGDCSAQGSVSAEAPSLLASEPLQEQEVGPGTWPLLLLFQGPGSICPAGSQTVGRPRLQDFSLQPFCPAPPIHVSWLLNLSLVPEAQGRSL